MFLCIYIQAKSVLQFLKRKKGKKDSRELSSNAPKILKELFRKLQGTLEYLEILGINIKETRVM